MKKLILLIVLATSLLAVGSRILRVQAQDLLPPCEGAAANSAVCRNKNTTPENPDCNSFYGKCGIITKAVGLYSIFTGVAAVIVLCIAAVRFVISSGDPNNVKTARNTVVFAVVGLVVAALGGAIVQFVLVKL